MFSGKESVIDNLVHCVKFEKYSTITSGYKAENIQVAPKKLINS